MRLVPERPAIADVAKEASRRIPGIRILFASGYANNVLVRDGHLDSSVQFIGKPVQKGELAQKVRTVLHPSVV